MDTITHEQYITTAQNPRRVAWHLLQVQAVNDNYIDLSAHMHASQLKLRGSYQFGGGVRPYLISGLVTRLR